jgi:hypothetical protein
MIPTTPDTGKLTGVDRVAGAATFTLASGETRTTITIDVLDLTPTTDRISPLT